MDLVRTKLERITDFWNNFVWNYKFIRNQIVWNNEVKTNYYGDILNYFNSTFDLIERKPPKSDFQDTIFYMTGLLQIIYVHQDLTDELLRIFKLAESKREDKIPNRDIRNELIGHPISRGEIGNPNKLISSVFWGRELTTENLHYIRYSIEKNFKGEEFSYKTKDIVESHHIYLNKYFDIMLMKMRYVLNKYSKRLNELQIALEKQIEFPKIVTLTSQLYEYIFELNYLYNIKYLDECYSRRKEHIRYQYVTEYFKEDLTNCLKETQSYIQELMSEIETEKLTKENIEIPQIHISYLNKTDTINAISRKKDYHYEIEKLHEKQPVFGLYFLKNLFKDDETIIEELTNMELNIDDNLEYYSSFEYVKYLIGNKE